jgi:hypothetical protein
MQKSFEEIKAFLFSFMSFSTSPVTLIKKVRNNVEIYIADIIL